MVFHLQCTQLFKIDLKMVNVKQMGSQFHLMETFSTATIQNRTESKFFEISTSNLKNNLFRFILAMVLD